MEQSLFFQWVARYFPGIVLDVVATLNGVNQNSPAVSGYLHKTMLTPEYSLTGRWESLNTPFTSVMADMVAMDSSLPLKKRDSIGKTNGEIPKMGIELSLNEKQLTDIKTLIAMQRPEAQLLAKVFQDVQKVITGIYERNEYMFLQALSSGVALADEPGNVGAGVRVDYGFLTRNKFGTSAAWASPAIAKPIDDITRIRARVGLDGNSLGHMWLDRATLQLLVNSDQVRQSFAFSAGFVGTQVPTLDPVQLETLMKNKFGIIPHIIDRVMRFERDGVQTIVTPWTPGMITFTATADNVGALAFTDLAEQAFPVSGVSYQAIEQYILVSKYRKNTPSLAEWTSAQARVIPVITNVNQIYQLDSTTLQA